MVGLLIAMLFRPAKQLLLLLVFPSLCDQSQVGYEPGEVPSGQWPVIGPIEVVRHANCELMHMYGSVRGTEKFEK